MLEHMSDDEFQNFLYGLWLMKIYQGDFGRMKSFTEATKHHRFADAASGSWAYCHARGCGWRSTSKTRAKRLDDFRRHLYGVWKRAERG